MPQCTIIIKNVVQFACLLLVFSRCCNEPDPKPSPLNQPEFRIEIVSRMEFKIILLNENPNAEYSIFRSVNDGPTGLLHTLPSGETAFSDTDIDPNNSYTYYIDAALESEHSRSETRRMAYEEDAYGYTTELKSTFWEYASKGRTKISADGKTICLTRGESLGEDDFFAWNELRGGMIFKLNENPGALGLACSPDNKWTAVGSLGTGTVTVFDSKHDINQVFDSNIPGIYALEFSPAGDRLYIGGKSNTIQVYSYLAGTWTESDSFEFDSEPVSIQFDESQDELLIASSSGVSLIKAEGTPVRNFEGLSSPPISAIFSDDVLSVIAAGKDEKKLIKWHRNTAEIEHNIATDDLITAIAVTPHKIILTGDVSGKVNLLDEDLNVMKTFTFPKAICDIAYHPDLDYAAVYLVGGNWAILKNRSSWKVQ